MDTTVPQSPSIPARRRGLFTRVFVDTFSRERWFLAMLAASFLLVGMVYQDAAIARWVGFLFASYAAIGNDSIQTIGTFIASNRRQKWYWLWLFIGGIFVVTMLYSWLTHDGDVSYGRLASKGFSQTPQSFSYLQVAAPLFLLLLTRMRMPVSTTFMLLTSFTTEASSVGSVLSKSMTGYLLAFGGAIVVWLTLSKALKRWFRGEPHPAWRWFQWITSGALWSVWLMQDAANIAVYLPRKLDVWEFVAFVAIIFVGIGLLFRNGGEKVQEVVDEKSDIVDVRSATIIDLVYACILYYFKVVSAIPMSTTWVFIGLLGGRELAMSITRTGVRDARSALKMMSLDLFYVGVGLLVSLILAMTVNEGFRDQVYALFGV